MFTLAFLTDPHIAPLPAPKLSELMGKRLTGYINWQFNRRKFHNRPILDKLTADILAQKPDHIAVGGDLVNLSLRDEFGLALDWLQTLGRPDRVSVIPGNHDAYVPMDRTVGIGLWDAYMQSDVGQNRSLAPLADGFPWVRRFGMIALIGLSSAVPKPIGFASGQVGDAQRDALGRILKELAKLDFFRIVVVHHPPLVDMSGRRRGLDDARELEAILGSPGAELVLHGHLHRQSITHIPSTKKKVLVVGGPSASASHGEPASLARYNQFRIWRESGRWHCSMTGRGLKTPDGPVEELERTVLTE